MNTQDNLSGGHAIVYTPEPIDGAARYATDLVKALHETGVGVTLFCPKNFVYTQELVETGVPLAQAPDREITHATLMRRLWRNMRFAVQSSAALFGAMKGGETVHFQNPIHFPLGFLSYCAVRLRRGHIVLTAHDPLPHRWRLPRYLRFVERAMLAWAYRLSDAVVVHNASGKQVLEEVFNIDRRRVQVIPHGATAKEDAESEYPDFGTLRLLCFGAIRENKGIHLAIQAVQELQGKLPIRIELTIRGELYTAAEASYWNECLQRIALGPNGIDVEEGFVPDEELAGLLSHHHAVMLPYTDFLSESGVAALALAHGRPLLATPAGGLGEMLDQLQCGIAIENPDAAGVAKAISIAFQAGREGLYQMGHTGRRNLLARRSWRTIAQLTAEVYGNLQKADLQRCECSESSNVSDRQHRQLTTTPVNTSPNRGG